MKHLEKVDWWVLFIGLVVIHLTFAPAAFRKSWTVDPLAAGQFGDLVGGYVGTMFLLLSVVLLNRNLRLQAEALDTQDRSLAVQQAAFAGQQKQDALDRFETKYFELIKLHRDNVAEMKLGQGVGRRVFVLIFEEFHEAIKLIVQAPGYITSGISNEELVRLAYYLIYFGTGERSSPMLRAALGEGFHVEFVDEVESRASGRKGVVRNQLAADLTTASKSPNGRSHVPFDGHQSRLGHYYRHLYQTVRFVHSHVLDIDKREYVKTMRAQLSTHEQALLLLNSLTPLGEPWWQHGLIEEYGLVKNLPQDFFPDAVIEPDKLLTTPGYFEWQPRAHGARVTRRGEGQT